MTADEFGREETELAQFQAALLELLAEPLTVAEIKLRLAEDTVFAPFRDYTESFEPRHLEVAISLVEKWGIREGASREAGTYPGYTTRCDFESEST